MQALSTEQSWTAQSLVKWAAACPALSGELTVYDGRYRVCKVDSWPAGSERVIDAIGEEDV